MAPKFHRTTFRVRWKSPSKESQSKQGWNEQVPCYMWIRLSDDNVKNLGVIMNHAFKPTGKNEWLLGESNNTYKLPEGTHLFCAKTMDNKAYVWKKSKIPATRNTVDIELKPIAASARMDGAQPARVVISGLDEIKNVLLKWLAKTPKGRSHASEVNSTRRN